MLSREDNETVVKVGPGTAAGNFMRLNWIPFLPSADLVADGQPKRVRLLGENLVAFRNSEGVVGLLDEACPHRGAPLAYARNEACGLRCVYHGWKFDHLGRVIDMPAEPDGACAKTTVRVKWYPCRERNGIVWTYMGPDKENPPELPNFEWNLLPPENVHVSIRVQECNWLQALEGDLDPAHGQFLHNRIDGTGTLEAKLAKRGRPTFDVLRQDFGVSVAAKRDAEDGKIYWRVNQFILPFYTMTPPTFAQISGHCWVPIDDEHTLAIMFSYHPTEPLPEKARTMFEEGHKGRETGHTSRNARIHEDDGRPFAGYWTIYGRDNNFRFDHQSQVTTWFSGIPGLWVQDDACQSGTGPILDRTKERLGVTDSGIVIMRRVLLEAIRAYEKNSKLPAVVNDPNVSMIRPVGATLEPDQPWWGAGDDNFMKAEIGKKLGYAI